MKKTLIYVIILLKPEIMMKSKKYINEIINKEVNEKKLVTMIQNKNI